MPAQQTISLDQKRAAYAWECVRHASEQLEGSDYDKFVALVKSAPALVMNNGLMQFLAFCRSKLDDEKPEKEKRYRLLVLFVLAWLADPSRAMQVACANLPLDTQRKLYERMMQFLHGTSTMKFREKSQEAMELLKWMKQQADAMKSLRS